MRREKDNSKYSTLFDKLNIHTIWWKKTDVMIKSEMTIGWRFSNDNHSSSRKIIFSKNEGILEYHHFFQ